MRIISVNVGQLWWPIGLSNRRRRVSAIASELIKRGCDIVCLQEVWRVLAAEQFVHEMQQQFPYFVMDVGPLSTGLMIFSRYRIFEHRVHHYSMWRGTENFVRKGILLASIIGEDITQVYTTHLQTGGGFFLTNWFEHDKPSGNTMKSMQLREARDFIAETHRPTARRVVFAGDFNFDLESNLFQVQMPQLFPRAYEAGPREGDRRIDHMWVLAGPRNGSAIRLPEFYEFGWTDHEALEMLIS